MREINVNLRDNIKFQEGRLYLNHFVNESLVDVTDINPKTDAGEYTCTIRNWKLSLKTDFTLNITNIVGTKTNISVQLFGA